MSSGGPTPVSLSIVAAGSSDRTNRDNRADVTSALTKSTASVPTVHQHWHCRVHSSFSSSSSSSSPPVEPVAVGATTFALIVSSSEEARCQPRLAMYATRDRERRAPLAR